MYKIWVTKSALRHARRLPPDVRRFLVSKAKVLKEKPLAGYKLRGKLNFLYSLHLRFKGVEYRVIYEVDKKAKKALVFSHKNFILLLLVSTVYDCLFFFFRK